MVIPQQSDIGNAPLPNVLPRQYFSPHDMQNTGVKTRLGNLAIGFHRSQRSFNERERGILNLIHPHIVNPGFLTKILMTSQKPYVAYV